MSDQHPLRAVDDDSPESAPSRPEPPRLPIVAPVESLGGIKGFFQRTADTIFDWYAAQSRTLRVGLLGGVGAICLIGVVTAASNALSPAPLSSWATLPGHPASVRVTRSAGPVPSSATASRDATTTGLPAVTETSSAPATSATTGTQKPTATTTQQTTSATQGPGSTTAPTNAASTTGRPTTSEPTTAPPTTDPPTTAPPTSDPPTTAPPTTDPPATDPPTTDPPTSDPPTP